MRSCGIQLRAISQPTLMLLFYKMSLKIMILETLPHFPGGNELGLRHGRVGRGMETELSAVEIVGCCTSRNPWKIRIKLKPPFTMATFFIHWIILHFCWEHDNLYTMLIVKFQNDLCTRTNVVFKRDFLWYDVKMDFFMMRKTCAVFCQVDSDNSVSYILTSSNGKIFRVTVKF